MDDTMRRRIEAYIPHPPDPSLEDNQYYFQLPNCERIIKVFPMDVLPGDDDYVEYLIYQQRGNHLVWVDANGDGDRFKGVMMGQLYDNKQDCADMTHDWIHNWQEYRKIQQEEAESNVQTVVRNDSRRSSP